MHLPTLGADLPAVLSRFFPTRRARVPVALCALVVGSAGAVAGCRDELQADSPAPALAPSAPPGEQSAPLGRCVGASEFAQILTIAEGFPLCVIGLHQSTARAGSAEEPDAFAYGDPAWDSTGTPPRNAPVTGGNCTKSARDADEKENPDAVCETALQLWTVGPAARSLATPSPLGLRLKPIPEKQPQRVWTSVSRMTLGIQTFSLFTHASFGANASGEAFLIGTESTYAFTGVDGVVGVALPPSPTLARAFYYTGKSPLYLGEPPTKAAPGIYRAACEVEKGSSQACTSELVTAWPDEQPGPIATDVEGNMVASHEKGIDGREVIAIPADLLGATTAGTPVVPRDPNRTTSLTIIGGKGRPKHLVAVNVTAVKQALPIQLVPLTFTADGASVEAPVTGSITPGPGIGGTPTLRVFHDAEGDLWIGADANGAVPGGSVVFLHFGTPTEAD